MKLKELLDSEQSLQKIYSICFDDVKVTFDLGKLANETKGIFENYFESRKKVLEEFGDSKGQGVFNIPDDKRDIVEDKIKDLENIDITIENISQIKLSDIPESASLTAIDYAALHWLIVDE